MPPTAAKVAAYPPSRGTRPQGSKGGVGPAVPELSGPQGAGETPPVAEVDLFPGRDHAGHATPSHQPQARATIPQ